MSDQDDMAAAWAAALSEQHDAEAKQKAESESPDDILASVQSQPSGDGSSSQSSVDDILNDVAMTGEEKKDFLNPQDGAKEVRLEDFTADAEVKHKQQEKLDAILDIPVTITMEVGHSQIPIRSLLQLNQGSVVELDRLAGEPLDVLVNGTLIAHGEVVVVNDKFGIRLTDVISQTERIKKLR